MNEILGSFVYYWAIMGFLTCCMFSQTIPNVMRNLDVPEELPYWAAYSIVLIVMFVFSPAIWIKIIQQIGK